MSEELRRNKSIISREINRHCDKKWNYNTGIRKKYKLYIDFALLLFLEWTKFIAYKNFYKTLEN